MHVLVTGGAGYIGSHTAKLLSRSGYTPVVLDDLRTGHRRAVRWGPFVEGNIADQPLVRDIIRKFDVQAVVHFAASAYVGESMRSPRQYFQNNVQGTMALLGVMLDEGVSKFVFSSTCATYGVPTELPITEESSQHPVNPYGESKLFVEKLLHWYAQAYDLKSVCLRYFNAAGADPEGEIGEVHDPETHVIPLIIQAAMKTRPWVEIYGDDYPTPDGTAVRDYIHVTDLGSAHLAALRHLLDRGDSLRLNLGTGKGHSVRDVVNMVESVSGAHVPVHVAPRRAGDPPALVADPTQAGEILGWNPQHSDLETIISTAWAWHAEWSERQSA